MSPPDTLEIYALRVWKIWTFKIISSNFGPRSNYHRLVRKVVNWQLKKLNVSRKISYSPIWSCKWGAKIWISFYFDVAWIIMKEENVVNWQPYWANLIMQNGMGVKMWTFGIFRFLFVCLLIYHKKVANLASKLATLSAEFYHANKLGAKMWTSIIANFYFDVAQTITKEERSWMNYQVQELKVKGTKFVNWQTKRFNVPRKKRCKFGKWRSLRY